ncbi:MAG: hypothetical protein NC300_11380 [Bacteroidales bacterium]|nr:hypothetical protein [Clostridium sp.]MCM1204733.1 hypothetical protein [Bacteroidales bacterium]
MKRLTIEYAGEYVPMALCTVDRQGGADDCIDCKENCEEHMHECENCPIQECFNRLAEYEDTGLTPEQIREMDRLYAEKCKETATLKENPSRWIPCSERLPDVHEMGWGDYIVTIEGAEYATALTYLESGGWRDDQGNCYHVLAWKEFPKAYTGGKSRKK